MTRLRETFMGPLEIGLSVDFGMTASGVAFNDRVISPIFWPVRGDGVGEACIKIPTTISYDKEGSIADWGFLCGQEQPRAKYLFKSLLDPQIWNASRQIRDRSQSGFDSLEKVRDCVIDYLTLLLESSFRMISKKTMSNNLVVNLIVTRPTTWTAAVVEDYRSLARRAFENATKRCNPAINLRLNTLRDETESHAAGVHVYNSNRSKMDKGGSIFYGMDVGGATTDPALLKAVTNSSGHRILTSLMNPPVPGIQVGCVDIDNCFLDYILLTLRSIWEQENVISDIEESSAVLSVMTSTVKALRFDENWLKIRNTYSAGAALPVFKFKIPAILSDEKNGFHGLPERTIFIPRDDMKGIFDAGLITPIREHLSSILQVLISLQSPGERPLNIAHVLLCGGGGFMPRVYECLRDQMGPIITRTDTLMSPSLGALQLVQDKVRHLHATLKVRTEKAGGGPEGDVWLARVVADNSKPPMFSQRWKHRGGPEVVGLRQHFVLVFTDELDLRGTEENWVVDLDINGVERRLRFGVFMSIEYRICLTLPTTTDVVTPINFSAFQILKDGQETKISCTARQT